MELVYVLSGLAVGFIVGMTGVGGGSLMTPILLFFGVSPTTAVGTDLLYAAITKAGGVVVHHKHRNIDWRLTGRLALGSVPAAILTLWVLHHLHTDVQAMNVLIKRTLGFALFVTAIAIIFKQQLLKFAQRHAGDWLQMSDRKLAVLTVLTGVTLGVIVTLTSIGAGALGTVALFMLYPLIPTVRLVGTEIAHAVPLTLVAGLGHAGLGNIDWHLLGNLLCGSLPGIYIGSHLSGGVPDKVLRPALAIMLAIVGAKLVV
ncbi:sulfite exporter TauE/SafE family protein [Chitinivorax sp. PXF-14]|uniref:sulfite exporter TauE/SafE family protein n=1 Tax=Chitinivorax sp. PXF-14 TaxID=3230488 RepID=UPI0034670318